MEQAGDVLECQPLNPNFVPSGPKRKITMDELIAKFPPEPEFYQMSVYPKMRELQQSVRQGMRIARRVKHFLPNTNIHARSRLMRKMSAQILVSASPTLNVAKRRKHKISFERIVKLEGTYEPQQKHLFNEFGINLRKK